MKTILQHTLLLILLLCCWSMPNAFSNTTTEEHNCETPSQMSTLPELSSPNDQATNISVTPNLQWTGTGSSYTLEVYNCNPDYNKVGQFLEQSGTFTKSLGPVFMNGVDDDFSGITYNELTGKFFAIINGNCEILELEADGTIIRNIELEYQQNSNGNYTNDGNPNNSYDDTEGIVWIGGTEFFIVEEREGRVTKINIPDGATYIPVTNQYIQLDLPGYDWGVNEGLEGISYNPATNEIIVVKEKNPRDLYVFEVPSSLPTTVTVSDALVTNFGFDDLAGLHHLGNNSGLSNMNISDHFLILSHEEEAIVETDINGVEYAKLDLLDIVGNHPEGITVDNLGNIYIAAENNEFYKYSNSDLDLNPFGLDPSTTYANTNVSTNSLTIPAGTLIGSTEYCWRVKDNTTGAWSDYYSFTTEMIDCSTDRDALVALYNATNGAIWDDPDECGHGIAWDLTQPMSSWYGVTLDANGCVIALEMLDNCLEGALPPEMGNLSQLQILDLQLNNTLGGPIPPELGQLTNLRILRLNANDHMGAVPPELGQLDNLEELDLSTNELTGPIPIELGMMSSLEILNFHGNHMSGTIPTDLGTLSNLQELDLSINNFQGTIPLGVRILSSLKFLNLSGNNLSGTIPDLSNLTSLETLFLVNNNFTGSIPTSIGSLTMLEWMSLQGNQLTGGIPSFLGNLSSLYYLDLSRNPLGGSINTALCNLDSLNTLDLRNNGLTGSIPSCLGDLSNLTFVYLEGNGLTGDIPSAITNSSNLRQLNTRNNQLSGCYDPKLSELCSSLDANFNSNFYISDGNNFDLPWDNFCSTGTACVIPCDVRDRDALIALYNATDGANWTNTWDLNQPMSSWYGVVLNGMGCVEELELNNNNLIGTIPPELGDLSNLRRLNLANNQLTGELPVSLANLTNLSSLVVANNQLTGCYEGLEPLCSQVPSWANQTISDGNYFNVPWESFCANGNCTLNPCIAIDREALLAAYIAFGGSNSGLSWDTTRPVNTWERIELNINGCVRVVDFSDEYLEGTIAPEIGNLSELEILFLQGDQLSGTIPPELGNLSLLTHLDISGGSITGNIPPELGNLSNLNLLVLSHTELTGNIPPELGNLSNLSVLLLNDNQLTGNIPPELGNLSNLVFLSLHQNQLSGCYDANLATLCNQITSNHSSISDGNNFDIPWEYFCNAGAEICLTCPDDYNAMVAFANSITSWGSTTPWDLTQPISTWDGVTLNADGCIDAINLDENNMQGTIPPELGNLSSIRTIHLGDNNFSGTIPPELGNLTNLTLLNLDGNAFTGIIPPELGNISTLNQLYLSHNQLSGSIPPELANLANLFAMNMKGNQLSGCYDNQLLTLCGQLAFGSNNASISDGNNLDAPWEDFCATTAGACTPVICANQQAQYEALRAFYLSTNGDNWSENDNWPNAAFFNANPTVPSGMTFATWDALTVNGDGCVIRMDFDDEQIFGIIPPELGNLTTLEYLDLGSNNLSGSLPAELGNLSSLTYLNLSNNNFTGNIPPELGNLTSLESMYINYNNLFGSLPPELGNLTNIQALSIRGNNISGNIPVELGNLPNLVYLGLDGNQLTGTIPASLGNITSLVNLSLTNNQLSGCYGPSLQNLCSQLNSYFNSNSQISDGNNFDADWEDFCASSAGECILVCTPDYNAMVAFHNAITDWGFMTPWDLTQPMNTWDGVVLNANGCVEEIVIDEDNVTGTLPPEIGDLSSLIELDLGSNNFAGNIPPELGNLTNLTFLNLSDNNFTGSIPPELGNLNSLTLMYLTYNQFSGNIPPELGNMTNLIILSLGTNQLSGNIPPELGNLTNLTSLTLRANQLTGTIPGTLGNMPNLTGLFLYDNQLSGCYDSNLTALCGQLTAYSNSNARISDGNNLDAPWEDFCTNGTAACEACPADLNVSGTMATGTYQADETLNATGTIPAGTDVEFKAGQEIQLNSGFSVEPGSSFSIDIEDCDGN